MAVLGAINSAANVGTQVASDADLGAQTIATVLVVADAVALGASVQTAINNIVADLNDLKSKMRTAGVLAA